MFRTVGLGQVARKIEQGLSAEVERAFPAGGRCVGEPELPLVMLEVAPERERSGGEDPCTRGRIDLAREDVGDRERRRVQLPAMRARVEPPYPVRIVALAP